MCGESRPYLLFVPKYSDADAYRLTCDAVLSPGAFIKGQDEAREPDFLSI